MRINHRLARLLLVVSFCTSSLFAGTVLRPRGTSVSGEVLVKIQSSASTNEVADIQHLAGVDQSDKIASLRSGTIWRLRSAGKSADALATALQKNPNIVYVEPNYVLQADDTPNDPSYSQLWSLKNTGQTIGGSPGIAGADISAEAAWSVTTGSSTVVIGVVDTGIDYTHPDLAANIWSNPGGKGNVLCAAGTHGFNAITRTCDPRDDQYHGTHVSGTIGAAGNNSLGVAGVNWTTSIMGLKFLDSSGNGTTADAIAAIDFAVQAKLDGVNVRILSNSWGGGSFSKALLDEINKANENDILFVASAGNSSTNTDISPQYPSGYNTPNMISVAATDNRDALAYFSNFGPASVHLGAPGVNILSCYPGSSYAVLTGTSMAAPHVAGVAALILAKTPSLTTAQVKSAILDNTDPVSSLSGKTVTGGRLNAARAVGAPLGPDYALLINPTTRSVPQGGSTTYTVTVSPSNGFSDPVSLAITGLPSGAGGTFSPNPATTTSTLSITTTNSTPLASSQLTITGTSAAHTHSTSAVLNIVVKPQVTACPSFTSFSNSYIGTVPTAIVAADFNRDGKADVAMTTAGNQVAVMLGGVSGVFQSSLYYTAGTAPVSIASGDFNGDGKPDLAVANAVSNSVSILLGNGDGTFQSSVAYAAGSNPFSLTVADLNGDGKPDLAVANNGTNNVSILLGQGDGTFLTAVSYAAGSGPFWISSSDLNRDGKPDLVVADYNSNKLVVLLGNGDGTMQAAAFYSAGTGPSSIAIADFNGDGKPDLAASNDGSNNVSILTGIGDGTFQAAVNYALPSGPHVISIIDVNGDGNPDLAVANNAANSVSILTGRGDATFQAAINYTANGAGQIAVADLNGDGRSDLTVINLYDYYLPTLLNNGVCALNCNTIAPAVSYAAATAPKSVSAGDFNGDGKPDVVAVNSGANNASIELGAGDGTLLPSGTYNLGSSPNSAVAGDFNSDGKLDLAAANSGSNDVSILIGNGNGTFQTAVAYTAGSSPHGIAAGDFNGDGKTDLAVANNGSSNVSILLGTGTGTFMTAVNYGAGTNPESVAVGDFNRDGKLDLAVANSGSNNVSILLGNGDGTFQAATNVSAGTNPYSVIAADLNGDGKLDLAVANSGSNNISVLIGNGTGTFIAAVNYAAGTNPRGVVAGDLNNDGKLDLAAANYGSNNVSILTGNGNGTFGSASNSSAGTSPSGLVIRDFNRDGKPDLATANSGSSDISVLLNTCPVPDLAITKTHAGSFTQGDTGKVYTITVSNVGNASTDGSTVTVADTIPSGLSATALNGSGWTCVVSTVSCNRSDMLTAGASYPAISLTVNVANSAPATVTNTATVSGGGELNAVNSSASDPATVAPLTDLVIASSHLGNFTQGDSGRNYRVTVRNAGGLPTSGTITAIDTLPSGLTATAISGSGWTCNLPSLTCTRSDVLGASSSFPVITVTVNVAANAPSSAANVVTVSGGGESNAGNDTASDPTTIWSSQTCGSFGAGVGYAVGSYPSSIAIGDFNHDGKSDLAVANYYSANVSILMGDGAGNFAAAVNYPVGNYPNSIATGDFNNDGVADVVVVNSGSGSISILLGIGDGTFAPAVPYADSDAPQSVIVGDFNGDGNADVAVVNYYSSVSVWLGTGNGTLQARTNYATSVYGANFILATDFNGDGALDIAVGGQYSTSFGVLLGNGDGTFQTSLNNSASYYYSNFAAAGDFNGDGKQDLVFSSSYSSYVSIFFGNGNGTFQPAVQVTTPYGESYVAVDDINGDGKADIVVSGSGSGAVSILLGNGNGTFQSASTYPVSGGAGPFVIGDFNKDGRADLAALSYYNYKVYVMLGGCPDLTIAKSHNGNFSGGQSNAVYSLVVTNSGGGSTGGLVTVTDTLPAGMTATAMTGSGWSCDLPNARCTRSDSLAGGANYPTITLTVSVSKTTATSVINTAAVSGGNETNTANDTASDPTTVVQVADLTITKTHDGSFASGQTGRNYTITVTNNGGAASTGTVTVIDTLPAGLTPTAMTGAGWICDLPSRTCTRNDALAINASYPAITLTVSVDNNAPSSVTNIATVSGGGEVLTSNDTAADLTKILTVPANLTATAIATTQVSLSWDPVVSATNYQILRSSNHGAFTLIGAPLSNSFVDSSLMPNTTYLYQVRAADASTLGSPSSVDLATTILFTDDPISTGSTVIKAVHVSELRTAVNAVRAAAGLSAAVFTDASLTGTKPKALHVTELRSALDAARAAIGLPALVYTDPGLAAGDRIKAPHYRELRAGMK